MAYKFIYGPNGTDKTEKCMNMLERCIGHYKHIFYVVPEYLSYFAENKVASLFGGVSEGKVNVTSFKKLYCETVNITGEDRLKKLTSGGVRIVMAYLCTKLKKELNVLGRAAANPGFSEIMARAVQELKTYNVKPQDLLDAAEKTTDSLGLKLGDIAKIQTAYEEFMFGRFSDAKDELEILKTKIIANPEIYKKSLFVFDGYQMFTPDQVGVISALASESDIAFAFSTDSLDEAMGDTYLSQNKSIAKLRKLLSGIEEKPAEQAEKRITIPENDIILSNLLYGKTDKFPGKPENIEIHEFADQHQETEFVAEKIIELVKSGVRYRDITVIARDGARYLPVIESLFKDYEIPVFIDKKLGAANQPAINAVLSALEILKENFSYESVFEYLKTGFSNLDAFETDLIENYVIATGIRGGSWFKEWKYTPYISQIFDSEEEFFERINQIKEKVTAPLTALETGLSSGKTVEEKCRAVYEFVREIKLYDKISGMVERFKISRPQTAAYYGRVWNLILKVMDETVEVIGQKEMTTDEFITLFTLGLSMHEISIVPTGVDVVCVVQPENISEQPENYVFVIGANERVYPSVTMVEGLLSDRDRNLLESLGIELAQDTVAKAFGENYVTLKTFMSAQKKLYISYPVGDTGGGARFAAVTVKRIKEAFPSLETVSHVIFGEGYGDERIVKPKPAFEKYAANLCCNNELSPMWTSVGEWYRTKPEWQDKYAILKKAMHFTPTATKLEKELTDNLYKNGLNLSVSSLEQYARCPFAYYANYTLRLKTREIADVSSADAGSLMHEAIEKLSGAIIKNGYSWKSAPEDFLERETVKITDEIIIRLDGEYDRPSARRLRMFARIKEMIEESVKYIADHLKAGQFEPLGYEIEFGEGKQYGTISFDIGGNKVRLRGKVDRADIYYDTDGRKYVRVIDYKSGSKTFDYSAMFYGLQMQLVVYLDRICEETDSSPAGILYFRLFDPSIDGSADISDGEISEKIIAEHKMSGVVLKDENIINAMDGSGDRDSRIIPVKRNANGELSKSSSVLSSGGFRDMQRHINRLIKKAGKEIIEGRTDVMPISFNGQTGCDYCDYKKICLFDEHCGGKFKVLEKMKTDEVLEIIGKEAGIDD